MHLIRLTPGRLQGRVLDLPMEGGERRRQGVDVRWSQLTGTLHIPEQVLLAKLTGLDHVFNDRAVTIEAGCSFAAPDGNDVQVEFRGEAPVQAQLFSAEMRALIEGGIIEETEIDRFLDLVNEVAGENYPGNVGFHQRETGNRMVVQGRVLQGGQQCLAHIGSCSGLAMRALCGLVAARPTIAAVRWSGRG